MPQGDAGRRFVSGFRAALVDVRRGFVEFDEHLVCLRRGHQKKIDKSAVGARPRCRIDGAQAEAFAEDGGGAINVPAAQLNLLDALAELLQISRDCAVSFRFTAGQDVERKPSGKMKLEFLGVLIRGHVGQPGQSAGFADFLEPLG